LDRTTAATLAAVTDALNSFLESGDWAAASMHLLSHALKQTRSELGFLAVVLDGPILRALAQEGVVWDPHVNLQLYDAKMSQQAAQGFFELAHHKNLFEELIKLGKTVVSNKLGSDPRSGGVPPGHPALHSFLGVPIFKGSTVAAVIAVANRPGGYTGEELRSLEAMSQVTGVLYDSYRQNLKRKQLEEQRSNLEATKPPGKGTALGISTVYGIVRQFEGHIYVESQPGLGSRFQLFFPVRASPALSPASVPRAAVASNIAHGLTVLIADDEPALRAAVVEYLRGAGHQVLESNSSHEALELARSHSGSIDVLITDVVMPGLRGTELAQQVAEFRPGVHVIFMSGYAQSPPEAQIPPGAAFLQKPFRFASLGEQLKLVARKA
jgi:CheY-like chemotaxis protein